MIDDFEDRIFHGHCLEVLKQLPDESFHAVITDPPYGLGTREPTVKQLIAFLKGANLDTGGDFMGADWEIPSVLIWRQVYRVLKPGGHVLSFGGTRAWDLISMGLRAAGFEYRDTFADEFPALQWIHGQGMPKSHNVGKALRKELGPEAVEAKLWEGWGSGLKPAWEPILVFRKPLIGKIIDNVREHGAGVLNIDATRVRHASPEDFEKHKAQVEAVKAKGGVREGSWKNASDLSGASDVKEAGRWPSNLVLAHAPECERAGTKKIKGITGGKNITRNPREVKRGEDWFGHGHRQPQPERRGHTDEDGTEAVEAWQCVEGCPVRELDEQSGDRPSTLTGRADPSKSQPHPGTVMNPNSTFLGERTHHSDVYADSGGASRFFSQFEGEELGKWECVEGCPVRELDEQSKEAGVHGAGHARGGQGRKTGRNKSIFGGDHEGNAARYGDSGGASRFFSQFDGVPFKYVAKPGKKETQLDGLIHNDHPTKKPLELMRWLVKLVCFKGAKVLDPYCGSGATLHAACEEEVLYTGIERDLHAFEIAQARMDIVSGREQDRQNEHSAFDLAMGLGDDDP